MTYRVLALAACAAIALTGAAAAAPPSSATLFPVEVQAAQGKILVTLARVSADRQTPPEVAALVNDRLERASDILSKPGGDAWTGSIVHMLKNETLLRAAVTKTRPHKAYVPGGMPIGETNWLEDDWMDAP